MPRFTFFFLCLLAQAVPSLATATASSATCDSKVLPKLELVYFDVAGRAEPIRIMLHSAGIEFTDTRFKGADWPTIKPTTPLGQVPILKVDDKPHCQSSALMRYAGKLSGFYPQDPLEALVVDEIADTIQELMSKVPRSQEVEEYKTLRAEFQETTMKRYAAFIEEKVQANGGVFCAGKSPSMADLVVSATVKSVAGGTWDHIDATFFDAYPGLVATAKAVDEDEKVKAYYDSKA